MPSNYRNLSLLFPFFAIFVVGLACYANSFQNAFQFDDMYFIVNNPAIRHLSDVKKIWCALPHPVRFVPFYSFATNYHFHQYDVFGYHMVNFAIHIINAWLVYLLVNLLFCTPRLKDSLLVKFKVSLALMAALIFVAHPLQTQAVTYISQRFASLATLFYVACLCFYLSGRIREKSRWAFFLGALVCAVLGMLSKQITLTIPLSILLCEFIFFTHRRGKEWIYALGLLPLVLVVPAIYSFEFERLNVTDIPSGSCDGEMITTGNYFLTQWRVLTTYLRLFIWPVNQILDYDFHLSPGLWHGPTLAAGLFLSALIFAAFKLRRNYPLLCFGILWFFVTHLVESSIIVIKHVIFEHRMYLPMVGLSIFASTFLHLAIKNDKKRMIIGSLIIAILGVLTFQRNFIWRDEFSLWEDNLKKTPYKARSYISLGIAHIRADQWDQALPYLDQAIALNPKAEKAYNNRGLIFARHGQFEAAMNDYNKALELGGEKEVTYCNRGNLYQVMRQTDKALADFTAAIKDNPAYHQAYVNRGVLYGQHQQYDRALADFNRAIELHPGSPEAYNNRGIVFQERLLYQESESDFTRALAISPDYVEALYNRANTYKLSKQFELALRDYQKVLRLRPEYAEVYNNRGILYRQLGKNKLAELDFSQALKISPDNPDFYYNRALVYLAENQNKQAYQDLLKARDKGKKIDPEYLKRLQAAVLP